MGRVLPRRQDQRDFATAHLVPAVPPLPALLPSGPGSFQRQAPSLIRDGRQAGLETHAGATHKLTIPRETLK